MKKFLALLLVLSLVFVFAACDGDDSGESSVPSSSADASVAESSVDASVEESSADASVDASVEESSVDASVDTSVDASVEESSVDESVAEPVSEEESSAEEVSVEVITTAEKTNYALNKSYETYKNGLEDPTYLISESTGTDWSDDGTMLTDGIFSKGEDLDTSLGSQLGVSVQYTGTGASVDVIFDLENVYGDLNSLVFKCVRDGREGGNNRGFDDIVFVYTSNDGVNWNKVACDELVKDPVEGAPEIKSNLDATLAFVENFDITVNFKEAATGRYVKTTFASPGVPYYVIQLDEIEIWN